jgi:hypothetical protein
MAVLPSADSATEPPAFPTAPVPSSSGPCCVNCASAICDEKSRAAEIRADDAIDQAARFSKRTENFHEACRMITPQCFNVSGFPLTVPTALNFFETQDISTLVY